MSLTEMRSVWGGLSIEEQGLEWAKGYWEHGGGDLQKTILVARPEDAQIRQLPPLMGENFGLRLDSSGFIYGSHWHSVNPGQLNGFELLYPRPEKVRPDYLINLPANKERVKILEFAQYNTIETAIRAQEHILKRTGEVEFPQAESVIATINSLVEKTLGQPLTGDRLETLAQETGVFLQQSGLITARDLNKLNITAKLWTAFTRDSLDRINLGATRFRLRSAYLLAVSRLISGGQVAEKYTHNLVQLEYERAIERLALTETALALEKKLIWNAAFENPRAQTDTQRMVLSGIVADIADNLLTIPRVRPYLAPARITGIALVGCPPEQVELNRQIINADDKFDWLINQKPVQAMIEDNQFNSAGQRINELRDYLHRVI